MTSGSALGSVGRQEAVVAGAEVTAETLLAVAAVVDRVHQAWAAPDTEQRVSALSAVCLPDVAYANPFKEVTGVLALAGLINELATAYPGYLPARTSGLDGHHGTARYDWALRDPAGGTVLQGIEIVCFTSEAQIASIVSFFGQPPRLRYTYQVGPER